MGKIEEIEEDMGNMRKIEDNEKRKDMENIRDMRDIGE